MSAVQSHTYSQAGIFDCSSKTPAVEKLNDMQEAARATNTCVTVPQETGLSPALGLVLAPCIFNIFYLLARAERCR